MLDKLCSTAKSWTLKIFLGVVLASFIIWEIPTALQYQGNDNLLISGKSVLTLQNYQVALNDVIGRNSYSIGRYLTQEEINQFRIPQIVLQRMYMDVLLDEEARRIKIGASDDSIINLLGQDPLFKGVNAHFDKKRFIAYTQQMHLAQNDIFSALNRQARRDQLVLGALGYIKAPDTLYSATLLHQREKRVINYLELTPALISEIIDPDEITLANWFENNENRFRAPEYRQITYMRMYVKEIARPQDVTEEAIKAFYEQNQKRFSIPEKRTIELLRFDTRAEADAAAAELADGTSFDRLAAKKKQSLTLIHKGPITKAELPTPMAGEVFALAKGKISAVVNDLEGPVIIRVMDIQPLKLQPLDEVQEEIRREIAEDSTVATLRIKQKQIEEARFEGMTLKELAPKYGLKVKEIIIDANGRTPDGKNVDDMGNLAILIPYAFRSAEGVDINPLALSDGFVWYHVDKVIASHKRSFDAVRNEVITAWKEQEIQRLLDKKAAAIKKELDDNMPMSKVAAQYKLSVVTERDIQRGKVSPNIGKEATIAVFSGLEGATGISAGADGKSRIVFKVISVAEPLNTNIELLSQNEREEISVGFRNDLMQQLVAFSQTAHPVQINAELYQRMLQQ
ncbi:MAG: peptidyl-prolyl cis-trans isomerase D [Candidatus Tokpelaia sp. JSC189]|nr:MAG: peptidyl-prolyl cis-trans isomerase D [Candidatus Tokpelaia sp. JSC189]